MAAPNLTPDQQAAIRGIRRRDEFMARNGITDPTIGLRGLQDQDRRAFAIREITAFARRLAQQPQAQQELAQIHAAGSTPALVAALASLDETGKPYLSADALGIVESTLGANGHQLQALVQKVQEHSIMEIAEEHQAIIQEAVEKAEPGSPESDPEIQAMALRAAIEKGATVERGQSPLRMVENTLLDAAGQLNRERIHRDENGKAIREEKWSDEEVEAGVAAALKEKPETIRSLRAGFGDKALERGLRQRFAERDAKNKIELKPEAAARLDREAKTRSAMEETWKEKGLEKYLGDEREPARAAQAAQADPDWKPHSRPSTLRETLETNYDAIDRGEAPQQAGAEPEGNSRRAALEAAWEANGYDEEAA